MPIKYYLNEEVKMAGKKAFEQSTEYEMPSVEYPLLQILKQFKIMILLGLNESLQ